MNIKKIKNNILYFLELRSFLKMEFVKNRSLGFSRFAKSAKDGFFSISSLLYDFDKNNPEDYLSDWTRLRNASKINDARKIVVNDKLVFHTMNKTNPHVPSVVAVTKSGKIYKVGAVGLEAMDGHGDLQALVSQFEHGLIIKPQARGGGEQISKVRIEGGNLIFEGACRSIDQFYESMRKYGFDFLMTEVIKQTGVVHKVYPDSLNTVRILTMFDPVENKPFVARAVQRFGTNKSGIVDNWTAGGICALVDIETGEIRHGATYPTEQRLEWHKIHPDTQEVFYGVRIPGWEVMREYVLRLSHEYYYIPYIGWDIVPMENGFFLLEGNVNSDVNLLQIHGGLLADPKVRSFYKHYKVI